MTVPKPLTPESEIELRAAFWEQVGSFPDGQKIKNCLQCGTCTGACPVSYAMDITPRETIALFRAGRLEDILHSRTIWLCASCYSCTVRCPMGIRVTDTMYAMKRIAMDRNIFPSQFPANAMAKQFMKNVYMFGRNYELGLAIRYFLKTNPMKLASNTVFGLKMIQRDRLGVIPKPLKNIDAVRKIIKRAEKSGGF